jgi:D-alanine--poly(phosphoribitol) ligase subunit 2
MEVEQIKPALRGYIRDLSKISPTDPDFTDEVHLFDYGYVDSLGALDLFRFVHQNFGVDVRETDLVTYPLNSIDKIAWFVSSRQRGEL